MPGQPGEAQAAAYERRGGGQAADGPALFGTEPTHIARLLASGVADHHLQLAFQILESQLAVEPMQGVFGMGHRDEFNVAQFRPQIARNAEAADGQVGHAFEQHFFDPRQHFFAQPHPTATTLWHERRQGANEAGVGVGRVDHQAHFRFPALLHVVGQVFQLAGLFHQLPGTAQQYAAGFGQHGLAPIDAQQRHAELILHAGHGVAH